jgi:uncharacterized protein YdeI (YjbR/CyaY-like superfamily)
VNPKVDRFLRESKAWRPVMEKLRRLLLGCALNEELKWGKPCYTFQQRNVALIVPLKESCALMFCKGALLGDAHHILVKPGENSQSGRWIKFTTVREINRRAAVLKAYLREAIEVEKAGLEVSHKTTAEFTVPEELQAKLDELPAFGTAFRALTPGRQRGYLLHFSAPKQSKTRASRVEKCVPRILRGLGLHDRTAP